MPHAAVGNVSMAQLTAEKATLITQLEQAQHAGKQALYDFPIAGVDPPSRWVNK